MTRDASTHGALRLAHVRKVFAVGDQRIYPVNDLSLSIAAGEVTVLMGRSGCGKSTLLKLMAGLLEPDMGEIIRPNPHAIAMVFQDPRLLPWKTVAENVALGLLDLPDAERDARIDEWLRRVGLSAWRQSFPDSLSGGQAQRVSLARALARSPEVLLLDEPFAALDALTRIEMQRMSFPLLRKAGKTIVMVTHDVREGVRLADRVLLLEGGRIREDIRVMLTESERENPSQLLPYEDHILSVLLKTTL